jgi:hypothetical protein
MKRYLALTALFCATACTEPAPSKPPQASINLAGYPPEFRAGYDDGCVSAKPQAARKRDESRFKADANYAQGWNDGHDMCRRR